MLKRERLRILLETCTVFTISTQTKSSTMCHGVKYTQKIGEEIICHLTECKIVVYVSLTLVDNIRLQVVGELVIKKILNLFQLHLHFVPATAQEAIQYSA